MLKTYALFFITALLEIAGCYAMVQFVRNDYALLWLVGGFVALLAFALLLTLHPQNPGRLFVIYGAIYILTSFLTMVVIDQDLPTYHDLTALVLILAGTAILMVPEFIKTGE